VADCLTANKTQNFDYDRLNRLNDAYTTGSSTGVTNWGETYTIDPWGNLTNIALYPGKHNSEILNAAPAPNNQLNGFCYDAAGNLALNATCPVGTLNPTYFYDAENHLSSTASWTYRYDGDGERVIKCTGSYPSCSAATLYWKGTGSDTLTETGWTGIQTEEYIFFNGQRVARRDGPNNAVEYYFADHLGSANVITGGSGGINKSSIYYPFGGEIVVTGSAFANNYKFTGKERDSESGLDYFGARYFGSTLGRFTSIDPKAASGKLSSPQSWNRYAYALNNPPVIADPDGKEAHIIIANASAYNADTVHGASVNVSHFLSSNGVKNVSVDARAPTSGEVLKSMFDKHTVIVYINNSSVATWGHNAQRDWLGDWYGEANQIWVSKNKMDLSGTRTPPGVNKAGTADALGNVIDHEIVHTAVGGGHTQDPNNLMYEKFNPYWGGTANEGQTQQLQQTFNRPGEQEKSNAESPDGMNGPTDVGADTFIGCGGDKTPREH
jgi:RHS repeat-associated protein